jgi:vanadium chloroperoxidase
MQDPILLWNEVALEANRVSHTNGQGEQTGPTLSSRALAIVHLAMYDAYVGVAPATTLKPYFDRQPGPAGTSVDEAIAAAAHNTLSKLYPSQQPYFDAILAAQANDPNSDSFKVGIRVAQAILNHRAHDPGAGSTTYRPSLARGHHRPDPENIGQGFHAPDYGSKSKGFAIRTRFRLAAPPFLDNNNDYAAEYVAALQEVRGKGIKPELMGALPRGIRRRDNDETLIGIFWGYDGAAQLGTPPRLYNQIVRLVAIHRKNTVEQNAQLFALVNVAMADAGILAWEEKYKHDFWRPVVGIREHDKSMGPGATEASNNVSNDCDSTWLPLGAPNTNRIGKNFTPPFPAYPSGHATFGAAALHMTRLFYGKGGRYNNGATSTLSADDLFDGLNFVSEELNGINSDNTGTARPRHVRNFPGGLWRMIEENGRSRVYLGVHWVFDAFAVTGETREMDLSRKSEKPDEYGLPYGGVPLGLQIAEEIYGAAMDRASTKWAPEDALLLDTDVLLERREATFSSSYLS